MQATLSGWRLDGESRRARTRRKTVVSLFDANGLSLLPWHQSGFDCVGFRPSHCPHTCSGLRIHTRRMDTVDRIKALLPPVDQIEYVIAAPPCRDLAFAGARWWESKRKRDPTFQEREVEFIKQLFCFLTQLNVPFVMFTPATTFLKKVLRPIMIVQPFEFGGHLLNVPHPLFKLIPPQDGYTKRAILVCGGKAKRPAKHPVSPVFSTVRMRSGVKKRVSPVMANRKSPMRAVLPLGLCTALRIAHLS